MPIGASTDETFLFARKRLLKFFSADSISEMKIFKKSVDARKKADIKFVYSVIATVDGKKPDDEKLARDGITVAKEADITPIFGLAWAPVAGQVPLQPYSGGSVF